MHMVKPSLAFVLLKERVRFNLTTMVPIHVVPAHAKLMRAINNLNFPIPSMPFMYESWGSSPIALRPDSFK